MMIDQVKILLVQDDAADALLTSDDLLANKVSNQVRIARDAASALRHLEAAAPDLVLLDVNLPGRDGRTVLRRLRADIATAMVPVILLVDSPAARDILSSESLPVQGYAYKPVDFECLGAIVQSLDDLGLVFLRG